MGLANGKLWKRNSFNFGRKLWLCLQCPVIFYWSCWPSLLYLFSHGGHHFSYLPQEMISCAAGRGTYQITTAFINWTQIESLLCYIASNREVFLIKLSCIITSFSGFDISGGLVWTVSWSWFSSSKQEDGFCSTILGLNQWWVPVFGAFSAESVGTVQSFSSFTGRPAICLSAPAAREYTGRGQFGYLLALYTSQLALYPCADFYWFLAFNNKVQLNL